MERIAHINTGVDIEYMQNYASRVLYFKHGDVNNVTISGNDKSVVQVPTREVMNIVSLWGVQTNFSGIFVLTTTTKGYRSNNSVAILNQEFTTTYLCNSREILKEVNALERTIVTGRKLANIDPYLGRHPVPMQLLLTAAMCNDPNRTTTLLRAYRTADIVQTIKSPLFRHIYKLIHPKTTFIKTPTKTLDAEVK